MELQNQWRRWDEELKNESAEKKEYPYRRTPAQNNWIKSAKLNSYVLHCAFGD